MVGFLRKGFGKYFSARVMIVVSTFCTYLGTYLKLEKKKNGPVVLTKFRSCPFSVSHAKPKLSTPLPDRTGTERAY